MRYLDEEDFARMAADREQIRAEVAEKLTDESLWTSSNDGKALGIHELSLIRLGWQMHVEEADRRLTEAVRYMKYGLDSSWAEIGKALGISKQAAQKRFGD